MLFCCLPPCSHSEHIGREQLLKERSDAQKLVNRLYIVVVKHSHVESTWLDKQRTSALALCESLMHSKRPGRIDRCRLGSTRSDTGAFLLRFLVGEIGPISLNKAFWEVLTMEFVWNIIF